MKIKIEDQSDGEPWTSAYYYCLTCKRQFDAAGTYVVMADENLVKVEDPRGVQKTWVDNFTDSGTLLDRSFCGDCGW